MASISTDSRTGRRTVQFTGLDGKRRSIRLGKLTKRQAEHVRLRVEHLIGAKLTGSPLDPDTARWVAEVSPSLKQRLGEVGLIHVVANAGLSSFIEQYIESRQDIKPATRIKYESAHQRLLRYFSPDRSLRSITPQDAAAWRQTLLDDGLAENTVRRTTGLAKQFFTVAIKQDLADANPFEELPGALRENKTRDFFITRDMADAVLRACPDDEWRLIFTLCRYGGLRCPSELLALRWKNIDFEKRVLRVKSPKTEHHEGHEDRILPLFPEVAHALAPRRPNSDTANGHVITRYRSTNVNLRTHLFKIIKRAGLKPWPKLFQNLRASRETELVEDFPLHVVTAWLGNSEAVARKHYLQVTEAHLVKAADLPSKGDKASVAATVSPAAIQPRQR